MKYPLRSGLAIPTVELGYTATEDVKGKTNRHHLYFERHAYQSVRWRSVFRNLVSHVVPMYVDEHNQLHETYEPPRMPSDTLMIETVQDYLDEHGVINCVKEKQTRTVYRIEEDEWNFIKGLYRKAAA